MIEMEITVDMLKRAHLKSKQMGQLRNSITKGQGNLAGFIGEEMLLATYPQMISNNTYNFDIKFGDLDVEVKTKRQKSFKAPPTYYEASIANYNPDQKTDIYVFCRVTNCYSKGWIIGWIGKEDYFNKAKFHKKGEFDPSNKFTFKADCWNLPYSALNDMEF